LAERREGMSWSLVAFAVLVAPQLAAADVVVGETSPDGLATARQVLPRIETTLEPSRVIYLNHDGVTVVPGDNESRTQHSSITSKPVAIPKWEVGADVWSDTLACVRAIYAPFAVTVTDADPGDVSHIEAIFGGSPSLFGLAANIAGISPFTQDCSVIPGSIVYTFTDALPGDAHSACEVVAQEIAHSYGLDHEMLASDPMTYLPYSGDRKFADQAVACGEFTVRPCGIRGATCRANQNSVALLDDRLGSAGTTPVTSVVTEPSSELNGGCSTTGTGTPLLGLLLAGLRRKRR
jgi:hypothetical protein